MKKLQFEVERLNYKLSKNTMNSRFFYNCGKINEKFFANFKKKGV